VLVEHAQVRWIPSLFVKRSETDQYERRVLKAKLGPLLTSLIPHSYVLRDLLTEKRETCFMGTPIQEASAAPIVPFSRFECAFASLQPSPGAYCAEDGYLVASQKQQRSKSGMKSRGAMPYVQAGGVQGNWEKENCSAGGWLEVRMTCSWFLFSAEAHTTHLPQDRVGTPHPIS
jgi:hypothetical protein